MLNATRLTIPATGLIAILLAACASAAAPGPSTTPGPSAVAIATPSPAPTTGPIFTPRPSVLSEATRPPACPILDQDFEPPTGGVHVGNDDALGTIETNRVSAGSAVEMTYGSQPVTSDLGIVRAGQPLAVELWIRYADASWEADLDDTITDLTIDVTLGGERVELASAVEPADAELPTSLPTWKLTLDRLPDVNARGILEVRLAWRDRCFSYTASSRQDLVVRSIATLASCARGEAAWDELLSSVHGFDFGDVKVQPHIEYALMYFGQVSFIDGPYPIGVFSPDERGATASPGETVTFGPFDEAFDVRLPDPARAEIYRRAGVIRHIEEGGVTQGAFNPPVVGAADLTRNADGTFTFEAPEDAGRYVVAIRLPYESACSVGFLVAGAGLDVAAS